MRSPFVAGFRLVRMERGTLGAMDIVRRRCLLAGTALGALATLPALAKSLRRELTAADVVSHIRGAVGVPWQADTVDRIVAGDPATPVRGIATTMMATLDVLREAEATGRNLVVAHEPTFWSHFDTTDALAGDALYRRKAELIAAKKLVVFRFHDHWHAMRPDGIATGMARALGWESRAVAGRPAEFAFDGMPLERLARTIATRLDAHSMRLMGEPTLPVRRVVALWGYASWPDVKPIVARDDVDLVICGEAREWELVPYLQDQIAAGARKALIVLNHVVSEQEGMRYCAEWLRTVLPELPIGFIAAREPLRSLEAAIAT